MADNTVRIRAILDDKVSSGLSKMRDKFDQTSKSQGFRAIAQGVGIGAGISAFNMLGSAIGAAGDFIGGSISKASDLNETMSKTNVTFGDASDQVQQWAKTSATAFGESTRNALEAASSFGLFFENAGKSADESANMSEKIVQLGGDLGSFFNISTSDALQKLQAGLSGEAEPLRRLGVFLSEAAVQAEASRLGFHAVNGQFTEGQKILARYNLIFAQTSKAQGDFARTSDGLANSQRIANAELENMQTELGQQLVPAMQLLTSVELNLFKGLNLVTGALNQQHEAYVTTGEEIVHTSELSDGLIGLLNDQAIVTREDSKETAILAAQTKRAGAAASTAAFGMSDFTSDTQAAGRAADTTAQKVDDLATTLEDELFGKAIAAGRKAELHKTIRDIKDQLAETTKKGDALILRGQLAEAEQALFDLDLQAAEKKGPDALKATLDSWARKFGGNRDKVNALLAKLKELYKQAGMMPGTTTFLIRSSDTTIGGRQHGGPVYAHHTYRIGEGGPELLHMGATGGYVSPNTQGWSGGGGVPVEIPIIIDGRELARIVNQNLYYINH